MAQRQRGLLTDWPTTVGVSGCLSEVGFLLKRGWANRRSRNPPRCRVTITPNRASKKTPRALFRGNGVPLGDGSAPPTTETGTTRVPIPGYSSCVRNATKSDTFQTMLHVVAIVKPLSWFQNVGLVVLLDRVDQGQVIFWISLDFKKGVPN